MPKLLLNNQTIKEPISLFDTYGNSDGGSPNSLAKSSSTQQNLVEKVPARRKLFLNTLDVRSEIQELDSYTSSPSANKRSNNDSIISGEPGRESINSPNQNTNKNVSFAKHRVNSFSEYVKSPETGVQTTEVDSEYQFGNPPKILAKKSSLPALYKPSKSSHPKDLPKTKIMVSKTDTKLPLAKGVKPALKISELNTLLMNMVEKQKVTTPLKTKEQKILRIYSPRGIKEIEAKDVKRLPLTEHQQKKKQFKKGNREKRSLKISADWTHSPFGHMHKSPNSAREKINIKH